MAAYSKRPLCGVQPRVRSRDQVWVDDAWGTDREYIDEFAGDGEVGILLRVGGAGRDKREGDHGCVEEP